MTEDVGAWLINFIATYPQLIWAYVGGMVLASVLRGTWPDSDARPKPVIAILILCDLLQLNISGPLKLVVKPAKAPD